MDKMLDIINLLKEYGTFIYTKDRIGDLVLMEDEIRELYKAQVIDTRDYQMALLLLKMEASKIEAEHKKNQ